MTVFVGLVGIVSGKKHPVCYFFLLTPLYYIAVRIVREHIGVGHLLEHDLHVFPRPLFLAIININSNKMSFL